MVYWAIAYYVLVGQCPLNGFTFFQYHDVEKYCLLADHVVKRWLVHSSHSKAIK